ncbi:hypothetical protein V6C42_07020 [Pseudoclostridium thermosuccinogenes]|uniref:hypothetical protein n=1 Tax=Clostridium thermosuccinogenes TaxID=84032 RepID=UPI001476002E|nr:hypothetical protein [Pseudoclostridium thermosuccinogenes]
MNGREKKVKSGKSKEPKVAPGFSDAKFGEKATEDEIRRGESTRVTRLYLDENDPS